MQSKSRDVPKNNKKMWVTLKGKGSQSQMLALSHWGSKVAMKTMPKEVKDNACNELI